MPRKKPEAEPPGNKENLYGKASLTALCGGEAELFHHSLPTAHCLLPAAINDAFQRQLSLACCV
jgi:hypothetical protein